MNRVWIVNTNNNNILRIYSLILYGKPQVFTFCYLFSNVLWYRLPTAEVPLSVFELLPCFSCRIANSQQQLNSNIHRQTASNGCNLVYNISARSDCVGDTGVVFLEVLFQ